MTDLLDDGVNAKNHIRSHVEIFHVTTVDVHAIFTSISLYILPFFFFFLTLYYIFKWYINLYMYDQYMFV